ncbi:S8 family peptidase [Streptomyces sp. NBC_01336]|uniref:S8 family peptidase n=1 Tax=Streptomyces sp. NBC_01336 TaxID=2903829 RepID=UPI002E0F5002|nr:S8 family peptidase [Streptomyces sp. NBC_01336]
MPGSRRFPLLAAAAVLALSVSGLGPTPGVAAPSVPESPGPAAQPTEHQVTLVTGDVVRLTQWPDGRRSAMLVPAGGGTVRHNAFISESSDGLFVIPEQARELVDVGQVDAQLFNVSALVEQGYDDAHAADLPLIVSYGSGARAARAAVPDGTARTRTLKSLGAAALRTHKKQARTFWDEAVRPGGNGRRSALDGGMTRIWLDAKVTASLDRSVPQIGAPAAWQAGYDGKGVKVAVLDSGIDATHPDLSGKVVESRNFTTEGDAGSVNDNNGHGTHVADTVVGSGAASDGKYKGVAPGARLVIGKVLDKNGQGTSSAVIGAMEWAAHTGAKVISMSLGSGPGNGDDPSSLAVERLTEETGALFVIAAGNEGPAPNTVSNPAAAPSALAVAAVDHDDVTASFSSRGPLANTTLKPDISAPGVGIVAARAAGTSRGQVVDDHYTALSGTSMATPHVSGAAAILVQEHPDWSPRRLKDALMSTSKSVDGATGYEQGAGRVDVARATRQTLTATGSVGYGFFKYGVDHDPVTRTVEYRNDGDTAQVLDLSVRGDNGLGAPLPAGMVAASTDTVTVPAHGNAEVQLTASPGTGPRGRISGALTATARDGSGGAVHTEFGLVKEAQVAVLTVHAVNHAGQVAYRNSDVSLYNLDTGALTTLPLNSKGDVVFRVQPGNYSLMGFLAGLDEAGKQVVDFTLAGDPQMVVDSDRTITLDGTAAKEIKVKTPTPAEHRGLMVGYERSSGSRSATQIAQLDQYVDHVYALPTEQTTREQFTLFTQWVMYTPEIRIEAVGHGTVRSPEYVTGSPRLDGVSLRRVVPVGTASPADLTGVDLSGRIALIRASADMALADQVAAVAKAGAKAALLYTSEPGRYLASAGTATLAIPALTLDAGPGQKLAAEAASGHQVLLIAAEAASRYAYDLLFPWDGRIPDDTTLRVDSSNSARIEADYHAQTAHPYAQDLRWAYRPGAPTATVWTTPRPLPAPIHRTEWVSANGVTWRHLVYLDREWGSHYSGPMTDYSPGQVLEEDWLKQVSRPAVPENDPEYVPVRGATQMNLAITPWTDSQAGHDGVYSYVTDKFTTQLSAHGEVLAKRITATGSFPAPYAEPTEYTLVMDSARTAEYWKMSTSTHSEWRFTSARPASGTEPLPLLQLYYDLPLDLLNRASAGGKFSFSVRTEEPGTAGPVRARTMTAEVSYDDGATWSRVSVSGGGDGRFTVSTRHPEGAGYVSLRIGAQDADGNSVQQTITRAYAVK